MKQWDFGSWQLDITNLWEHPTPIAVAPDHAAQFEAAWKGFLHKSDSGTIGFFDWPTKSASTLEETKQLAAKIKQEKKGAVCIGIGGSYLGALALQTALADKKALAKWPITWVANADSGSMEVAKEALKQSPHQLIAISKSGGTTETLAALFHLSAFAKDAGIAVITDPEQGELRRLSQAQSWPSLSVPKNIGGRFSVLTAVGLLPLELAGIDTGKLLFGAFQMRETLLADSVLKNAALWYAYSHFLWDTTRGRVNHYLMPYHSSLKYLGDWNVQLWGESLGKINRSGKSVGPTPIAALGTQDQHSLLQLFKEGPANRLIGFMTVAEKNSPVVSRPPFVSSAYDFLTGHSFSELNELASRATEKSLRAAKTPTYRMHLQGLTPEALGSWLFFQETACALAAEFYGVDAFDQPGVEETKQLWRQSL